MAVWVARRGVAILTGFGAFVVAGMASKVRIVTINKGEEAIIRVNSGLPITLEFPGQLVSLYYNNGLVFQRIEKTSGDDETQEIDEMEAGSDEETQQMETQLQTMVETQTQIEDTPPPISIKSPPIVLRNLNLRSRRKSLYQDIQDLQQDLFN